MKVISICHMFPNRAWPNKGIFVKERLKALSRMINNTIVAPIPYFPFLSLARKYKGLDYIPLLEDYDTLSVYHPRYFMIPKYFKCMDGQLYYCALHPFISQMIKNYNFEILDFHWVYPDAFAGLKWAREFGKKIVVTIRGNESICYLEKSLRKRMVINTLKSVDHIIAVSNDMKEKVVQEYGVERKKVTVIPNGIDPKKFFRTNKLDAQKQCGLELGSKYILALSRLSPEKGLDSLIKAFLGVSRQDTTLLIVGDGPLKSKLEEMVKDLGISKKVLFFGAVPHDETVKWYNAADVFCLPSLWEGCPNVVIESLASGTPVVASNVGGIPDLIPNDSYGILVPAGDPVSLARALDDALNKEWDREKIAKFGSRNTWDHVAGQIIEVFEKVLR